MTGSSILATPRALLGRMVLGQSDGLNVSPPSGPSPSAPAVQGALPLASPITVRRGDREWIFFTVTNLAENVSIPNATFTLSRRRDDPNPVLRKTVGNGITGGGNELVVSILPADLSWVGLLDRGFYYDLQLMPSDNTGPVTAAYGRLMVLLTSV